MVSYGNAFTPTITGDDTMGQIEKAATSEPWLDEKDEYAFGIEGVRCFVKRHDHFGTLSGYIDISPDHPWHGMHYDAIGVHVHCGLTFSGSLPDWAPYGFWVGFDCCHAFDIMPRYPMLTGHSWKYRDIDYVKGELRKLVGEYLKCRTEK